MSAMTWPEPSARPEWEILLLCARSRPQPACDERLRTILASPLDWTRLIQMAWTNRMVPLLRWHLLRLGAAMPDWVSRHLDEAHARNTAGGQRMTAELARLAASFERTRMPMIAFKGPTLEALAYAQPGLRECADLDILIREEDVAGVVGLMNDAGYGRTDTLTATEERVFRGYHFAYEFVDPGGTNVDAHWRLLPATWTIPVDYAGLWQRSRWIEIAGTPVRVFADEDILFYLALHSTKERWLRLRMVCDFAEFVQARPDLDWERALSCAAQQGGQRMLLLAAHLAATWLQAPVPERIRALARGDRVLVRLEEQLRATLESGAEDLSRVFELSWFRFSVLDRVADRVAYVLRTVTTPRLSHTAIVRLPPSLVLGYIPIKLVYDYLVLPVWKLVRPIRSQPAKARDA